MRLLLFLVLLALAAGCDTTPETTPMNRPLDQETAMEADQRMRGSTDSLLRERQEALE